MPIFIPNLGNAQCDSLSICAVVDTKDSKIAKRFKTDARVVRRAKIRLGNQTQYLRLITGGSFDGHLHLDVTVAKSVSFPKRKAPKPTHTMQQIQKELDSLFGLTVDAAGKGVFVVAPSRWPPMIEVASVPATVGGITISMTEGVYAVKGAPIGSVRWILRKDRKEALIELQTTVSHMVISQSYLEEFWRRIESGFAGFVTGGPPSAPAAE